MDTPVASSNAPDHSDAGDLPCPHCGYNLHGITSPRCPECGRDIDYGTLALPRIPWENRRRIGRVRAYLRTVAGFTFRPQQVGRSGAVPIYADSVRFRAITVILAFLGIMLPVLACRICMNWSEYRGDNYATYYFFDSGALKDYLVEMFRQQASLAISLAGVLLALIAITGLPAYFSRPASLPIARQLRSAALANYTCAPLAWLPLTLGFLAGSLAFNSWLRKGGIKWGFGSGLVVSAAVIVGVQMFLWWLNTLRVLRAGTQAQTGRIIANAIWQPLASLVLMGLIPVGLQLVISYLTLVVVSLLRS